MPGTKILFNKNRPRDICIEIGVDEKEGELTYFMFNEPALNTFDEKLAIDRDNLKGYRLIEKAKIKVQSLATILNSLNNPIIRVNFVNAFPVSLSDIIFDTKMSADDIVYASATFVFDYHQFIPINA